MFPIASLLPLFLLFLCSCPFPTLSRDPHAIAFRSPNLYPEGLAWDPSAQHFLAGSIRARSIAAVSDAGVVETLISDPSLPPNASFLGLAVDAPRSRLLAAVHAAEPLPPFDALAAYDLRTRRRLFLALLPDPDSSLRRPTANAVAVDSGGNAFVTNSAGNFIWKVSAEGEASIFSRSPLFAATPVDSGAPYSRCGLNGIAYVSKGYLLVVQSNTGKMFKVDADDGTARVVALTEELRLPDGIAVRRDGVAVVVSPLHEAWFVKSDDSWGRGVVYDRSALEVERFPTSVVVGGEGRVYVIYGHVEEGMMGNAEREWFGIQEIRAERESEGEEEGVWVFVLIGLALTYFLFWRFQMAQLVKNISKKTN